MSAKPLTSKSHACTYAVQIREHLLGTRSVPPIPHQVTNDAEQADELHAGLLHARVRRVTDELCRGAAALNVREHRVPFGAQGQSEERRADVSHDAGDDDLGLVGCLHGSAEFGVVPGT